jgi:DNA-directed RNA polymerase subunit alpha
MIITEENPQSFSSTSTGAPVTRPAPRPAPSVYRTPNLREVSAMRIRWRGLELPTRVLRDEVASTPRYGRFSIEPFERGFGTTVGNSLRRILLSSLEGAAVTHVRIKGVEHEFSTLPGVLEDVTVIILNVKSLIVRLNTEAPKTMRVSVKGQKGKSVEVRASAIVADAAIDVINQDQLIATLTDAVEFEMEMTVGPGRSYATADDHKVEGEDQIIGVIPVDSVYSPVTRVRYRVEETRVGQRTNYDRLVMEIWTNGTLTPEMALVEAAKILRKHLNPFVQYFEMGSGLAVGGKDADFLPSAEGAGAADAELLGRSVLDLDLSVRSSNCLISANVTTIGDLIQMDEAALLKLRSFGKTSLREIKRKLAEHGLTLRGDTGEEDDADDDDDTDEEMIEGDSSHHERATAGTLPRLDSLIPPPATAQMPGTVGPSDGRGD